MNIDACRVLGFSLQRDAWEGNSGLGSSKIIGDGCRMSRPVCSRKLSLKQSLIDVMLRNVMQHVGAKGFEQLLTTFVFPLRS